jgi:hypothetical protein
MLKKLLPICLLFTFMVVSCDSHANLGPVFPLNLASFTKNNVTVSITLLQDPNRQFFLSATFTPGDGLHLYSKDLPRDGANGEGRPTLVELLPGSTLGVAGDMTESVNSEVSTMGPDALLVYPAGPVTLRLPVTLPMGKAWAQEQVSITYEACTDTTCLTPVIGKLVPIRIPEANLVDG